ncbi:hypothetical protein [Actinocorallia longicatena]|uniref:CHAT domain-containing protein n=1 Tax=Actinocorallia longicatena TaxID=111803 RepID=A0ABP6QKH5_9ACTN
MASSLEDLLGDPAPSLLPWLARRVRGAEALLAVAAVAAGMTEIDVPDSWPVVADAVADVLAERVAGTAFAARVEAVFPAVAGRSGPSGAFLRSVLADAAKTPPGGAETLYLLPWLRERAPGAEETETALTTLGNLAGHSGWYSAAMCARIAPYLSEAQRDRLPGLISAVPDPWFDGCLDIVEAAPGPWASPEAELAAAHPDVPELTRLAGLTDPGTVAGLCAVAVGRVRFETWEPSDRTPRTGDPRDVGFEDDLQESEEQVYLGSDFPESAPERLPVPAERVVSTGLSDADGTPLNPGRCLSTATDYRYWLEIAAETAPDSFEPGAPVTILPGTELVVTLSSADGAMVVPGADVGRFTVLPGGSAEAGPRPGGGPAGGPRLWFPLRTPDRPGEHRIVCRLYCRQTLLQTRQVTLTVDDERTELTGALRSELTYVSDSTLRTGDLAAQPASTASLHFDLPRAGAGTFGFFGGDSGLVAETLLAENPVQEAITEAREKLRTVAYGSPQEYTDAFRYRYAVPDLDRTADDLVTLAIAGYRLWDAINTSLSGGRRAKALRDLMRAPGIVEIAGRLDHGQVVPAGLLYDHPLTTTSEELSLCPDSFGAISRGEDLRGHRCFLGACSRYEDRTVVCPGGFWGFRHQIGLPQSRLPAVSGWGPSAAVGGVRVIRHPGERPTVVVGASTDFDPRHPAWAYGLGDPSLSEYHERQRPLIDALGAPDLRPHLVYFYCHGMMDGRIPLLQVGPLHEMGISPDNVGDPDTDWSDCTPLVFLNGCETTAVQPANVMGFLRSFVQHAGAAGVIGTEITVFTSLAAPVAERLLTEFVTEGRSLGEALLATRLGLLASGNPLGLAYVAYAPPQLVMRAGG